MGRKYRYPKHHYRSSGTSGIVGALLSALAGRSRSRGHRPVGHGHAYRPRSVRSSILSYVVRRLLKKFF